MKILLDFQWINFLKYIVKMILINIAEKPLSESARMTGNIIIVKIYDKNIKYQLYATRKHIKEL